MLVKLVGKKLKEPLREKHILPNHDFRKDLPVYSESLQS